MFANYTPKQWKKFTLEFIEGW